MHPSRERDVDGVCRAHGSVFVPVVSQEEAVREVSGVAISEGHRRRKARSACRPLAGDGCEVSVSCLACPLERCRYDVAKEGADYSRGIPEPRDPVAWVAWRVGRGEGVSVELVMGRFGVDEGRAAAVMGSGWPGLVGRWG